eukprot:366088-Chlamydomonas_euryale.AAC.6
MRAALSHPRAGACCGSCSTTSSIVSGVREPARQLRCGVVSRVGLPCVGLGGRARGRWVGGGAADNDGGSVGDDEAPATSQNALERTIKRKSEQVQSLLLEMGEEALEDRLQGSLQVPTNPPYRLATLIADSVTQGRTVLVYEVGGTSRLYMYARPLVGMHAHLCTPVHGHASVQCSCTHAKLPFHACDEPIYAGRWAGKQTGMSLPCPPIFKHPCGHVVHFRAKVCSCTHVLGLAQARAPADALSALEAESAAICAAACHAKYGMLLVACT